MLVPVISGGKASRVSVRLKVVNAVGNDLLATQQGNVSVLVADRERARPDVVVDLLELLAEGVLDRA